MSGKKQRRNFAIFDAAGLVYTGSTRLGNTEWSTETENAVLFSDEDRAWRHIESDEKAFEGSTVKEVR